MLQSLDIFNAYAFRISESIYIPKLVPALGREYYNYLEFRLTLCCNLVWKIQTNEFLKLKIKLK